MTQEHNGHNGNTVVVPEMPEIHEVLRPTEQLIALQSRLLLGGNALNPEKIDLQPVTPDTLGDFPSRDYSPIQNASGWERSIHWNGIAENNFATQKKLWTENFIKRMDEEKHFYESLPENDPKRETRQRFVKVLGIYGLIQEDREKTIKAIDGFYQKFLDPSNKTATIKEFISYTVNHFASNTGINHAVLKDYLPMIRWVAHVYGHNSAEIVEQMIEAEVKNRFDKDNFINDVNKYQDTQPIRINNLNEKEKELLKFLWLHKGIEGSLAVEELQRENITAPFDKASQYAPVKQEDDEQKQQDDGNENEKQDNKANSTPSPQQVEKPTSQTTEASKTLKELLSTDQMIENKLALKMYQDVLDAIQLALFEAQKNPETDSEMLVVYIDALKQLDTDQHRLLLLTKGKIAAFSYSTPAIDGVSEERFPNFEELTQFLYNKAEQTQDEEKKEQLKNAAILLNIVDQTTK